MNYCSLHFTHSLRMISLPTFIAYHDVYKSEQVVPYYSLWATSPPHIQDLHFLSPLASLTLCIKTLLFKCSSNSKMSYGGSHGKKRKKKKVITTDFLRLLRNKGYQSSLETLTNDLCK